MFEFERSQSSWYTTLWTLISIVSIFLLIMLLISGCFFFIHSFTPYLLKVFNKLYNLCIRGTNSYLYLSVSPIVVAMILLLRFIMFFIILFHCFELVLVHHDLFDFVNCSIYCLLSNSNFKVWQFCVCDMVSVTEYYWVWRYWHFVNIIIISK